MSTLSLVITLVGIALAFAMGRLDGAVVSHKRRLAVLEQLRTRDAHRCPRYANELGLGGWVYPVLRELLDEGFVERVRDASPVAPGSSVHRVRWRLLCPASIDQADAPTSVVSS